MMDKENPRIDGWFLCIAPLESPQLAIAVIVEGGGYGSRSAAPIAAALVLKARDLGYFNVARVAPTAGKHSNQARTCALTQQMKNRASSHLLIILMLLGLESPVTSRSIVQAFYADTKRQ